MLVLPPSALTEYFELVIGAYRTDKDGKLLVEWLREDWNLFAHSRMDDSRAKDLLAEILDDGEIVRTRFAPTHRVGADRVGEWEQLRGELMYRNRYFPDAIIDLDRLKELIDHLKVDIDELDSVWYRARIGQEQNPFTINEMGAPPKGAASHGRANPAGIPYLYVGSTPETAIAEIRPHTGEVAYVADFNAFADLKLIDLRNARSTVSPFVLEDADDIGQMRFDLPFLEMLGDELTRPVIPQVAAVDYTPSQYVCEFIKKCGFDGVVYRSSVSDGINLALFDPQKIQPGNVTEYIVERVLVDAVPRAG